MSKLLKSLSSLFLGILLAIAVGEFVIAQFVPVDNPPGLFERSKTRAFQHHPGFKGRDQYGNPIRINSMGLRDQEYSLVKPEGVYRILVLGDSIAFGDGVVAEKTFSDDLERILNTENPSGKKVEVLNAGIRGYNTYQELQLLKEVGLQFKPDMVITAFALNDAEPFSRQAGLIDRKHEWLIHLKDFVRGHSYIYAFFRKRLEVLRRTTTPVKFNETYDDQFGPDHEGWRVSYESLKEMKAIADERGITLVLAVFPRLEARNSSGGLSFEKIYEQVRDAGKQLGFETVDLLSVLKPEDAQKLKITDGDYFHPNIEGHARVAKYLSEIIRSKYLAVAGIHT